MDKLEPLIRHKFWIIFGLTLPIALFAYFSASGKMAEATTAQETKLDGALNGVPKGDVEPNQTYADGAKVINEDLEKRFNVQVQKLWESQTDRMTWPAIIVPHVPATYRGVIPANARYTYQRGYKTVLQQVWERVQPYVGETKNSRNQVQFVADWPQKVIIDGHNLPHANFNMSAPAPNKDIWDAQEDIWLLGLIFDAVARTNAEAQFVSDAPVRRIDKIELVGGSGASSVTSTATVAAAGGSSSGEMEEAYDDPGVLSGGEGDYGSMGGGAGGPASVAFNVAEEFGPQIPAASTETAAVSDSSSSSSGEDEYGSDYDGGGSGGMFGVGAAGVKMQRYIGEAGVDPFEGPYRERGFYMSVIILQDRIPAFLAELSSSPWPIRIGRFQIGENPYAEKASTGGGFGSMAFGSSEYGDDYGAGGGGFGAEYESEMGSGFGGMGYGSMGGGQAVSALKLPDYMKMPTSLPKELLSHPDLVQMDFCGIITMYNPVTDASVEVTDDGSTEEDFEAQLEESPETPQEAQAMAAEEAAAAAAGATAPADAAPAADPATTTDPAPAQETAPNPADAGNPTPEQPAADAPPDAGASQAPTQ